MDIARTGGSRCHARNCGNKQGGGPMNEHKREGEFGSDNSETQVTLAALLINRDNWAFFFGAKRSKKKKPNNRGTNQDNRAFYFG
jgi:hypothetical protein